MIKLKKQLVSLISLQLKLLSFSGSFLLITHKKNIKGETGNRNILSVLFLVEQEVFVLSLF